MFENLYVMLNTNLWIMLCIIKNLCFHVVTVIAVAVINSYEPRSSMHLTSQTSVRGQTQKHLGVNTCFFSHTLSSMLESCSVSVTEQ